MELVSIPIGRLANAWMPDRWLKGKRRDRPGV